MNLNVGVKLAVAIVIMAMLNAPQARSQNSAPPPTAAQMPASSSSPPSGVQIPGTPPANSTAPAPEYPLSASLAPDVMPRRYIELWNTGRFRLLNGMFVGQLELHTPRLRSFVMTPKLVWERVTRWRDCMPDLNFQIMDTITQGEKVVLLLRYTGTYEKQCYSDIPGPVAGTPPVKIYSAMILIFGLKDGKILDIWEMNDELDQRLQMGATWCNETQTAKVAPSPKLPPDASPNQAPSSVLPSKP
jgi:hypothetical protein